MVDIVAEGTDYNKEVAEAVGRAKAIDALKVGMGKCSGPSEELVPLVDEAYELGLRPEWDGLIVFPEPILMDGEEIHGIFDFDHNIGVRQAYDDGIVSEEELTINTEDDDDEADFEEDEHGNLVSLATEYTRYSNWAYRLRMNGATRSSTHRLGLITLAYQSLINQVTLYSMNRRQGRANTFAGHGPHSWSRYRRGSTTRSTSFTYPFTGNRTARRVQTRNV